MKLYIFLAHTIGGLTGSATYVRNKMKWLENKGWSVIVFDGTGANNTPVIIEEFKQFENNRIKELYFSPSVFWKNKINNILNKITSRIPQSDLIVIESNNPNLAMWGELLASRLCAKHIIYTLGEKDRIRSDKEFDFFNYKASNEELFCIDSKAVTQLFNGYKNNINPENHYWNASNSAPVEYYKFAPIDSFKKNGKYIGYFGREKTYLKNVIEGIIKFAIKHANIEVFFVLLGVKSLSDEYVSMLSTLSNLQYQCIEAQPIIPRQFFDLCDVIIANAACARIAFEEGCKVISMNVETDKPLGILGYTTNEISFESTEYRDGRNIDVLLEEILVNDSLRIVEPKLKLSQISKGFDFQESFAYKMVNKPYDVLSSVSEKSISSIVKSILLNMGFVNIVSNYRYSKRRS